MTNPIENVHARTYCLNVMMHGCDAALASRLYNECTVHFRPVRQRVMNFARHQMLATLQDDRFPDGTWWRL